jgi:hypothetical protein
MMTDRTTYGVYIGRDLEEIELPTAEWTFHARRADTVIGIAENMPTILIARALDTGKPVACRLNVGPSAAYANDVI